MQTDIIPSEENEQDFAEKAPKKRFAAKLVGLAVIVLTAIITISVVVMKNMESSKAEEQYLEIEKYYNLGDYSSMIDEINIFNNDYKYDSKKTTEKVEKIMDEAEKQIFDKIVKNPNEEAQLMEKYIKIYPNSSNVSQVKQYYSEYREYWAIRSIDKAKEYIKQSQYSDAMSILQRVVDDKEVSQATKEQARNLLSAVISATHATNFRITGGSSEVYIISDKSYGIVCPKCGYISGAMNTSDLYYTLNEHCPGDKETFSMKFMCASEYQGGCRQFSNYTLKVEYE